MASLHRPPPAPHPNLARRAPAAAAYTVGWLLDVLQWQGVLDVATRRAADAAVPQRQARLTRGRRPRHGAAVSPAEVVLELGLHADGRPLDGERLAQGVAAACGLPYCCIDPLGLDMALITSTLSRPYAQRHGVLPLALRDDALVVAVENPLDAELAASLQALVRRPVVRQVASRAAILQAIGEVYGYRRSVESAAAASQASATADSQLYDLEQLVRLRHVHDVEASDQHLVNAVDYLIRYAIAQRASDIHIEPRRQRAQVRLRIDGVLHDVHTIPRPVMPAVASRIKTLARLDIAERRRPQDGRIKTSLGELMVDMRVSTLPTAFGEKIVLRLFDPAILSQDVADLGLAGSALSRFRAWIQAPHGLVLITGPTGSGKTTTLYAALRTLADAALNITTVEDPIEQISELFNQTAVQPRVGLDFAGALRTILRQDPDVIMVGEIRDRDTAEMAVKAALTGHLVLSTLHTNDSATAVTRLLDLGVAPYLVGATLRGVMAQRLLRTVCPHCAAVCGLGAEEASALGLAPTALPAFAAARLGVGCGRCRGTGQLGRAGIFELLEVDEPMRQDIARGADAAQLLQRGRGHGLRTLREEALAGLARGDFAFAEVLRLR